MHEVELVAPLSGWLVALDEVPDPVFSARMVGDGISLDPVSQVLLAPCAGEVSVLHPAGHAVTLQGPGRLEVMLHIGIDTVSLKGKGFRPKVKAGDRVETGQPLIEFDADLVARSAPSLVTQILITNPERVASLACSRGLVEAGRDRILVCKLAADGPAAEAAGGPTQTSAPIVILNPHGLHARPAAVLVGLARGFSSEIKLVRGEDSANARSVVGLLGLQVQRADTVRLVATGADAADAIAVLSKALEEGLGEEGAPVPAATAPQAPVPVTPPGDDPQRLLGVCASPGLAVGTVFQVRPQQLAVSEVGGTPHQERGRLDEALAQAAGQLRALHDKLAETDGARAAIFAAHEELLEDPELLEVATSAIDKGKSAAFAWHKAYRFQVSRLSALSNELLAARANDLQDVGERVLRLLTDTPAEANEVPPNSILVAEDLTPSQTATLDRTRVLGFCTTRGGATSHVAILARSLDIPAVAGIDPRALEVGSGTPAILDGANGCLRLNPDATEMDRIRERQQALARRREAELASAAEPARTRDGHDVEVVANIGGPAQAREAVRLGGEGVGLLRSEFLFLERSVAPTEAEQAAIYSEVAEALGPDRTMIVRLLDVGGDKPLPYLPIPHEENPFLGERGVRVLLTRPELLRTHVRAVLAAAGQARLGIMLPMVASREEWRAVREIIERERQALGKEPVQLGIMVEVPAAAVLAERFAPEVDFFSIGTNDLTQYTLAMDRGHPRLAAQVDGLHPAVLHLIDRTCRAALAHGRWVGVCGGLAGDPQAIPILLGLGVTELSVSVPALAAVKAQVRRLQLSQCRALAEQALAATSAAEVRALVEAD